MRATTVSDLGALVRSARQGLGMTQADLADRLGVSRDWVVRLERGHPRAEAQRVLDALAVLGLVLDVSDESAPAPRKQATKAPAKKGTARKATGGMNRATVAKTGRFVAKSTSMRASQKKAAPARKTAAKRDPFDVLFKDR